MAPYLQGFLGGLAKAEVVRPREKLFRPVYPPGRQQFLGTDESELDALLIPDQVLSAVPTGQAEVGGADLAPFGEVGQEAGIFVVGVGADVEDGAHDLELLELLKDVRAAVGTGRLGFQGDGEEAEQDDEKAAEG